MSVRLPRPPRSHPARRRPQADRPRRIRFRGLETSGLASSSPSVDAPDRRGTIDPRMKARLRPNSTLVRLFTPGLYVKRWLLLLMVGIAMISLAVGYILRDVYSQGV